MKNTKKCLGLFSFYDRTGMVAYLEKEAEKGWMLDKISAFSWTFRRIEPQKLHFSVVYFSKVSAFEPEPSEEQLAFYDFCEHTDWKLVASNAQMQVFCNATTNPTPIETDATLEVASIHVSVKKSYLSAYYFLIGTGLLQIVLFGSRLLSNPIYVLANNFCLISGLCWLAMLILSVMEIVRYYNWYKRAKSAAERDGSFVETKGYRNSYGIILSMMLLAFSFFLISYGGSGKLLIAIALIVVVLCVTAIILGISELMKKVKLSAKFNRNITFILTILISFGVAIGMISSITLSLPKRIPADTYEFKNRTFNVYLDEIPLTIEDLIDTDYDDYSYEIRTLKKSVFIEYEEVTQYPRWDALSQPGINYSITTIKVPFVYEWCKRALLDNFAHDYGRPEQEESMWEEHILIEAAPWAANKAYQLKLENEMQMRFLLCYDNCIVEIEFEDDWQITTEQMRIVAEKLGK